MAEERKLIKLGNSSFAVALPKEWISKSGLKKGDKVFILPNNNGELMISSEFKKNGLGREIIIEIDGKNEDSIQRDFISAYINGNTTFQFRGSINNEKKRYIKKLIQNYMNCEIAEEKDNFLTAKDFFNIEDVDLNNFTRRADNNIREMFGILINGVKTNHITEQEINDIKEADADINRLYFLSSRIMTLGFNNPSLISTLKTEPTNLFNSWWIAFHLEHIGDGIKGLIRTIRQPNKNKESFNKLAHLLIEINKLYEDSMKSFYEKDKKGLHEIMERGKLIWEKCDKLTRGNDAFLSATAEKLKNIENASYQIIKMILNLEEKNG